VIGISKLYCGTAGPADALRYGRQGPRRPVVVWNLTRRCNLACIHCYARADDAATDPELTPEEGRALIDDLAGFGVPVLLFSGGEPLLHPELPALARHAADRGLRTVLSTNGTLIDGARAATLRELGFGYIGISLDGLRTTNDRFRGREGAFDDALAGMRACRAAGLRVGLRYTITRGNVEDVPGIFDLVEAEGIPRVCFYHLVYTGRGATIMEQDLDAARTRQVMEQIVDRTADLHRRGVPTEVLTVDNHTDGPWLYLRMQREGHPRAETVMSLLRANAAASTGIGIGCISWDGTVFPDQFWRGHPLGNVRRRPFSAIWQDAGNPFLQALRERRAHVKGRCATCRFLDICGGNFRARAEAATGDLWAPDPACYLTDAEIAKTGASGDGD
jgi:radical SAM protein with 4Fe4S-binding SPASM domain